MNTNIVKQVSDLSLFAMLFTEGKGWSHAQFSSRCSRRPINGVCLSKGDWPEDCSQ